ncbi:MAG TPA: hypothetical protein VIH21_02245 [Dehalococcoidia bacterium]|jgi:hypothetical protein
MQTNELPVAVIGGAREVLLDLPETGVCNVTFGAKEPSAGCCGAEPTKETDMAEVNAVQEPVSVCCGGPAPKEADACCVKDADAKGAGESGCGCGTAKPAAKSAPAAAASCCGS